MRCRFRGQDILRPVPPNWLTAPDMFESGYFPLVPFSNRIAQGRFTFEDTEYVLQPNHAQEAHPLHGFGWLSAWTVASHTSTSLTLSLYHHAQAGIWPWSVVIMQTIEIVADALKFTLSAKNIDEKTMPIGLGFHPYFANYNNLVFKTDATHIQPNGPNKLPSQLALKSLHEDLGKGQAAAAYPVDNCFAGSSNPSVISWTDRDGHLVIKTSPNLPYVLIYSNPEAENFCLEPASHINDALNLDQTDMRTGLRTLQSNEVFEVSMTFAMET